MVAACIWHVDSPGWGGGGAAGGPGAANAPYMAPAANEYGGYGVSPLHTL